MTRDPDEYHWVPLARSVTPEQRAQAMEVQAPGVSAEPQSARTYPLAPWPGRSSASSARTVRSKASKPLTTST
ncbi:hypothetical protein [Nesterenkonia pannonica]|uniref:hypothetical protein n=1 Tax=Nesterenkonia pannonica TaxID=1548602 RepID=UPI0021649F2A|nr:hypothetical protein [Nesterenkonia pannonica]